MLRDAIGWTTSILVLVASGHPVASAADTPDKISFNRDIRPILSNHCYACHGPDAQQRQADFRVDRKLDAYSDRGGYHPLVPGDPANSALYGRIATDDPDEIMPPTDFGKPLSGEQIDLIRRWIQQGADWAEHWSFVPPQRSEPAAIRDEQFARNAIDRFVLARLEAVGLQPSPAAAKTSLIRRVTFDLTGLPPTIEETDTFLADDSPDAYEKVVDRLLDSPHYGEHMARQWLDLARYSDTHGMHTDSQRSLWPFRDWLIRAFNQNMPFDQFTIEQLAGDLLPDPTREQLVATGFNRCNPSTDEGGSIAEEMRVRYAIDRVETIGTVWMGLSLTCTVCHDHKFDPIRQREFYQLFAYYANIDENPINGNALAPEPSVDVPTPQQEERRSQLQAQIAALEQKIRQEIDAVEYETPIEPGNVEAHEPRDYIWFDDSLPEGAEPDGNEGADSWQWVTAEKGPVHSGEKSHTRTAIGLSQHYFTAAKPTLTISAGDRLFAYVYLDANNPPLEIMLNFKTVDWEHRAYWGGNRIDWGDDNSAARLPMGPLPQTGQWVRLEVDSGAVGLQPGDEVNGWAFTQFDGTVYWDQAGLVTANPHPILFESLLAWEESQRDVEESSLPEDIQETLKTDRAQRSDAQRKQIREYFIEHAFAGTRATFVNLHEQLDAERQASDELEASIPSTMIMRDRESDLRDIFLLVRGQYDRPDESEKLQPSVPAALPPLPEGTPSNRLGLSRWLVSREHPLTARVTMNRLWQYFFGVGIVKTAEEFGARGDWPTHPQLLDWLAVEFMESGWDVKQMQKLIVMSATYRQSARVSPELYQRDPENRLLARGPRFRLDAEAIRDQALAVSGLLVKTIGGKGVKPYQPDGIWRSVSLTGSNTENYEQEHGDALYRRSMYTFWKRTTSPPTMAGFDAPSRNTCSARRERTNTPLQALVLLNDTQHVEAARRFAQRIMTEGGIGPEKRMTFAFRMATSRRPDDLELPLLLADFAAQRSEFEQNAEAALQLVTVGESSRDETLDVGELASWTMVANLILNLDETVNK